MSPGEQNDLTQVLKFELKDNVMMLNTIVDIFSSIVDSDSLEMLFSKIAEHLCQHIGFDKSVFIVRKQEEFHVLTDYNFPEKTLFKRISADEKSLCFCVNDIGSSLLVKELIKDFRFNQDEVFDAKDKEIDVIARCFHLDNEVMGIFLFYNSTGDFFSLKNAHDRINYLMSVLAPHLELKIKNLKKSIEKDQVFQKRNTIYRLLAENMSNTIWTTDMDFNITYMSPSVIKLCGSVHCPRAKLSVEDNIINLKIFFQNLDAENIKTKIKELSVNSDSDKMQDWPLYELRLACPSGEPGWAECCFSPFYDENGKQGIMVVAHNITQKIKERKEKERQQQELIQADKMITLGILVSGVAHEINNPNHFIKLNSSILKEMYLDFLPILDEYQKARGDFLIAGCQYNEVRDKIVELFNDITIGVDRIEKIVSELKDYVRETDGDTFLVCDINDTLKSAIKLTRNLITKSTESFTVSYGEIPAIKINSQRVEQVLINLIKNACYALKNNKDVISISTYISDDGKHVICEVADAGCGMSEENLKLIFEPFYTTRRNSGGLGLGLSISNSIVKKNGGQLFFKSIKDKGTSAFLKFPVDEKGDL